jgi:hypothetical protein
MGDTQARKGGGAKRGPWPAPGLLLGSWGKVGTSTAILIGVVLLSLSGLPGVASSRSSTSQPSSTASSPPYANRSPIPIGWTAEAPAGLPKETCLWSRFGPGGEWIPFDDCQSGFAGTFLFTPVTGDGTYYFQTIAEDLLGESEEGPAGDGDTNTVYDTVLPTSEAQSPEVSSAGVRITVTWTASDLTSGLESTCLRYKFGSHTLPWQAGPCQSGESGSFTFPPPWTGVYYFQTIASDRAGNVERKPDDTWDTQTQVQAGVGVSIHLPLVYKPPPTWQRGSSTAGLTVYSLAPCPANCQVVYAGTKERGVLKSTDGGRSWSEQAIGLADTMVNWVLVPGQDCGVVYAATWGLGVQKTTDGGNVWTPASTGLGDQFIYVLAADPTNPQVLYAGTASTGVYKSSDGGASWVAANSGLPGGALVDALALQPGNSQHVYAGTWGHGIYRSTNAGASWSAASTGLDSTEIYALAVHPPQQLYAATKQHGVYRSDDGADSWVADGLPGMVAYTVVTAPDGIAYAGTDGTGDGRGVYVRSTLGTWQPLAAQPSSPIVRNLALCDSALLAGTADGVWWYRYP